MSVPTFTLSNGFKIPALGFGVFQIDPKETFDAVKAALDAGYRHVDTSVFYSNELETAKAIKAWLDEDPSRKREEVYYTTKLPNNGEITAKEVEERITLVELLIGYVDLLLVHIPGPTKESRLDAWKKFQDYASKNPDKVHSIGVSNYSVGHLKELFSLPDLKIKPVINQVELNPWLTRKELAEYCKEHDILMEAWGPLTRGARLNDPEVTALAEKYGVSPGQVLLNWSYQKGFLPIAKSVKPARMKENIESFKFTLSKEEVAGLSHDDEYWNSTPFDPVRDVPAN